VNIAGEMTPSAFDRAIAPSIPTIVLEDSPGTTIAM
jgi:hypothetical protein